MEAVKELRAREIDRICQHNFRAVEDIYTDMANVFGGLWKFGYLYMVNHSLEYVHGDVHTNRVESAWSLLKRGLVGVYHHISAKYLQDYLDEFAFRFSHRHGKPRLMDLVLASC